MLLRDSEHRGDLRLEQVIELAWRGRGADPEGYRVDFISLVERYRARVGGEEHTMRGR
jgi:Ca-activated chloride channel homolog